MCFSPQADLVGGVVISCIGVDSVRHAGKRRGQLALATLPLIFGAHQIVESFVWWAKEGGMPMAIGTVALWIYLLVALVLLPVFVPLVVMMLEPVRRRRRAMTLFLVMGGTVACVLFVAMVRGPIDVTVRPYHLAYSLPLKGVLPFTVLYVIAVCGALLLSSFRDVAIFGAVNLVAVAVIATLTVDGFASVWCGWAAVTSAAIALHMRFGSTNRSGPALAA